MASLRAWAARVGGLFGRPQADRDLVDELNGHLDAHVEDNIRAGMARDEARRQAALRLGGVDMTTEAYREQRTLPWLEHVARDMRHAGRTLRRSPGFAAASALTLALAIGANVSIFTVVYRVLLKPLPYGDSSRLIALDYGLPSRNITIGHQLHDLAALLSAGRPRANPRRRGCVQYRRRDAQRQRHPRAARSDLRDTVGRTCAARAPGARAMVRGRRGGHGRAAGRRPLLRALGAALRPRSGHRRPVGPVERRADAGGRRHAGRLRVS